MAFPFNQFSHFSIQRAPRYATNAIADALNPVQAFADAQARADAEDQAYEQELAMFHAANTLGHNVTGTPPRPSTTVLYRMIERQAHEERMAEAEEQRAMSERRIASRCNDTQHKRLKFDDDDDSNDSNNDMIPGGFTTNRFVAQ